MKKEDLYNMYKTDPDLIRHFHIKNGQGLEICTEDTWQVIKDHSLYLYDWGYFSIYKDNLFSYLGGFFIWPEYRNAETKRIFYKEVCSKMPSSFFCSLYNINTRAIKFLLSLPKTQVTKKTKDSTMIVFRKESL